VQPQGSHWKSAELLKSDSGDAHMTATQAETMDKETVAVLGAGGTMGFPIARNIAQAGIPVRAWNRSRDRAEPLTKDGAYLADSPADAAYGAGLVITMLADEDAVIATMDGPQGALSSMSGKNHENGNRAGDPYGPQHAIWVQMSTVGEAATKRCAELANRSGVGFVDAPVLGTRQPADERKLVVLESGPQEARPRLQPIFDAIGHRTIRVGEAGAGSRLKLVINSWVVAVVAAGAETIALAEGLGLEPDLFFKAVEGGALDLPYLRIKGKAMAERDFTPAFRLALAAKDAALVREAAERHGLDLPVMDAIARRLAEGAKEHGDMDFCASYLTSAPKRA
jgi:3-hydroxyisobutyrate dehydrogenase